MPKYVDIEAVERAARIKLDTRIQAIRTLATARQNKLDRQAEAAAAEREDATAWIAAVRQGWSEDELKDLGFDTPAKKLSPRSRRRPPAGVGSASRGTSVDPHRQDAISGDTPGQAAAKTPESVTAI